MCDEFTLADNTATLSRRQFGAIGAAAAALGMAGEALAATPAGLTEGKVSITTPDGTCDAFFVHPAKGKHPAVILWPDIAGLRPSHMEQARWIAAKGYAVIAVNHYYRGGKAPVLASFAEWRTPEGQAKLKPMIASVNPATTARDAKAFVAWLDHQAAVNTRRGIGSCGFCMTGSYTVRAAAAVPGRVTAAASFHGGGLVSDAPDAPVKLLGAGKRLLTGESLFITVFTQNGTGKARVAAAVVGVGGQDHRHMPRLDRRRNRGRGAVRAKVEIVVAEGRRLAADHRQQLQFTPRLADRRAKGGAHAVVASVQHQHRAKRFLRRLALRDQRRQPGKTAARCIVVQRERRVVRRRGHADQVGVNVVGVQDGEGLLRAHRCQHRAGEQRRAERRGADYEFAA